MAQTDTVVDQSGFAHALRDAVAASGLGLESIQRHLAARRVEVSIATLSYWQSGARSPGRRRSEEVVAHLESVLDVPPRSLRALIPPPRRRGPAPSDRLPELTGPFAEDSAIRRVAERVAHCRGQLLTRLSQHDVLVVRSRRVVSLRSRMIMRADLPGIDSIGLTQFFEDSEAGCPQVQLISGGSVQASYRDPEHRVIATEVGFGHELRRGETLLLEFEVTSDGAGPADRAYDTRCGVAVRELTLQVRFEGADLPAWCESFQCAGEDVAGAPCELRRRVEVGVLGHAHAVALECPSGTFGMTWDWDADTTR